ncbi:MAG: FadR family transcriptional regulator [Deltaproteobacteria bacterium]|nr:FadR family transcriptional regulator [Deltaproteobacteria bacterium]
MSDQLRDVLKQALLDGRLKPGDKLPSEEELAAKSKVSKVTVREALRAMEAEGLVERRRGVSGGTFMLQLSPDKLGELVTSCYRLGSVTPEEMVEFRKILEPGFAALAAERRTEEDLERMRLHIAELEESMSRGEYARDKILGLHRLIARACHNQLIEGIAEGLFQVFEALISQVQITPEDNLDHLQWDKKFYECIRDGAADAARDLMNVHFAKLSDIVRRNRGEKMGP